MQTSKSQTPCLQRPTPLTPRRGATLLVGLLAAAAFFPTSAPCATREEIAAEAKALKSPVTLTFWQTHNQNETDTLKEIVADFQKEYPQIKIQMDTVPFAESQNKFKTASKAGQAPDVFRSEVAWTADLAALGYLQPLDEYLTDADKATYLSEPMKTGVYEDETWGLPQVTDCLGLLYNKATLTKADVTPPKTMDELASTGKKLTNAAEKRYAFAYPSNDSYFALPFIWAFGGSLINETDRTVGINNAGAVAGLEFMIALRKTHQIVPPTFDIANDYNNQLEDFKAGRIAMIFMGPWATASILEGTAFKNNPTNLGVAAIPSGPAGTGSPIGGHHYVISASSKNAKLAYLFIDTINSAENQSKFALRNNLLPTRKAAYDLPAVKQNAITMDFRKLLDSAKARPVIPEAASIFPPLTSAYQAALRGEKTPKDALDSVAREWEKLLKK